MLVMALLATLSLSSLLILQIQDSPVFAEQNNPYIDISSSNKCVIGDLLQSGPKCEPRPTLVELPTAYLSDGSIIEVIPNLVQVQRCQGVCHQSNSFHKCVPHEGGRINKTIEVSFEIMRAFLLLFNVSYKTLIMDYIYSKQICT